ncbi:MAG TPA: choice-of-anchor D domain-containing protein, partial [Kofleriaceae bacterium]
MHRRAPGLQRCHYNVRSPAGDNLLGVEAACLSGNIAALVSSATSVDLGSVAIGTAQAQTITIRNSFAAAVGPLAFELTDLDGNFVVQAPCNPDARSCDASVLVAPGASFPVTVACAPRATGPHTAQLYLVSDLGTRLMAPIALACTGTAAIGPVLAVPPAPVDVGDVEVFGGAVATRIHLTNTGTAPLTLGDIQTIDAGTGAALDWSYTATSPCASHIPDACTLGAGGDVALDLTFDPSALGVRDASLLVNYR